MRGRCDDAMWQRVLGPLEPDERGSLAQIGPGLEYELDVPDKLYRSFARVTCGDDLDAALINWIEVESAGGHRPASESYPEYREAD